MAIKRYRSEKVISVMPRIKEEALVRQRRSLKYHETLVVIRGRAKIVLKWKV